MQEIEAKLDKILDILEIIATDLHQTKKDAEKMSEHIDAVDFYVTMFDKKFRRKKELTYGFDSVENSLD